MKSDNIHPKNVVSYAEIAIWAIILIIPLYSR